MLVELVQIPHVVLDVGEPVFARHPGRADSPCRMVRVVTHQGLRRDDQTTGTLDTPEIPDELAGEFAVAVTDVPEIVYGFIHRPDRVVPSGSRDLKPVFTDLAH